MSSFYQTFEDVREEKFDGLVITGAPVEQMEFEEVNYWRELTQIIDWAEKHVFSTLYICWAAQAGLYYHYGVRKYPLREKCFGVFEHRVLLPNHPLMRGFDAAFYAPHSRHTEVRAADVEKTEGLLLLSVSDEAGVYIAATPQGERVFVTGHSEYEPTKPPLVRWRAHSNLLFQNWLNYCVYQRTPFDYMSIGQAPGTPV